MNTPVISVIVAVFNAEKTLDRLFQSLVSQTLTDFEVLLIDDGSTDSSGLLCNNYAQQDHRFRAFHKPNEGIGSTRQFGIDHANGEYTIHADSDDWVEPDWLEQLYQKAVSCNVGMTICDILEERGKTTKYVSQQPQSLDRDQLAIELLKIHGSPCNKLIRRNFYKDAGIGYVKGLNYGEDKLFNIELVLHGISVAYLPKALYHYDLSANPDSAVHSITRKQVLNREKYVDTLRNLMSDDIFQKEIDYRHLETAYYAILSKSFSKSEYKNMFAFLSRVRWSDYGGMGFPIKAIVWTSLHISFQLSVLLSDIKQAIKQLKHRRN